MSERDVLLMEVGASLSILGLLLVFFPLFLQRAQAWAQAPSSQADRRFRNRLLWLPAAVMALAAADASIGLLTLWGDADLGALTGWLLLLLVWATVVLTAIAILVKD